MPDTDIHMTPEEGVRAHLDLRGGDPGGVLMPIHWGTFNLAPHPWAEPGEWMKDAAGVVYQAVAFPRPGAPFEPGGELPTEPWWRALTPPVPRVWHTGGPERSEETTSGEPDLAGDR